MEVILPEWTSKKQVEAELKKARLYWKRVRKAGHQPGDKEYDAAKAECVKLDNILRRM